MRVGLLILAFSLVFTAVRFAFSLNLVQGWSMEPTLKPGDITFAVRYHPWLTIGMLKRDSLVVFTDEDSQALAVKRLIGLPGERVRLTAGKLYLEDKLELEGYVMPSAQTKDYVTVKLGANEYFLLGDNRAGSTDSRKLGPVQSSRIRGVVICVVRR